MAPRAAKRKPLRLEREHGAYRFFRNRSTARELAAARRVRRSNARGVRAVQVSQCRNCQHWQSVCEHRPQLQCELSRCQSLRPALAAMCEWRTPEAGGWDRPGRQTSARAGRSSQRLARLQASSRRCSSGPAAALGWGAGRHAQTRALVVCGAGKRRAGVRKGWTRHRRGHC